MKFEICKSDLPPFSGGKAISVNLFKTVGSILGNRTDKGFIKTQRSSARAKILALFWDSKKKTCL